MHTSVPAVEIPDHADAMGVRRPDGEVDAVGAADAHRVRAQLGVDPGVVPFAEQIEIEVGEDAAEPVGIVELGPVPVRVGHAQAIVGDDVHAFEQSLEHAVRMPGVHHHRRRAGPRDFHPLSARQHGPDHQAAIGGMRTENRERIGMSGRRDQRERIDRLGDRRGHAGVASVSPASPPTRGLGAIHSGRSASSGRSPGPPSEVMPVA
jgi:hypothetical protein